MSWARDRRVTVTPSRHEVNLRAIHVLPATGWKLYSVQEWPLIGAAPKGYLAFGDPERADCVAYIAKKGRLAEGGHRECVTEEIISKIGAMLPIPMAESKLVRLPTSHGAPPDVRFLSKNFVRRGEELLVHGIEIVAQYFDAKPDEVTAAFNLADKRSEQSFYTIHNMVEVFSWYCRDQDERELILNAFARMLAFDALVGAPDRHALNWGVIESIVDASRLRRFAPLYDTARGLFREHTDAKLTEILESGRSDRYIADYADKSRPVFGVRRPTPLALPPRCNHFQLIEAAVTDFPEQFGSAITSFVRATDVDRIAVRVQRLFQRIITRTRMNFIVRLLRHRHARLQSIVGEPSRR